MFGRGNDTMNGEARTSNFGRGVYELRIKVIKYTL